MKKIKVNNVMTIILDNNSVITRADLTEKEQLRVFQSEDESEILQIMVPSYSEKLEEIEAANNLIEAAESSQIVTKKNDSYYWEEVSELSLPPSFLERILRAEQEENTELIETYHNFWTLLSLNTDERCRQNLFWFLQKYGMTISKSGFFVAYRNVYYKGTDPDGTPVYTDGYTRTFRIKIGEMVTQDRSKCDSSQDVTCSKGLHAAGAAWLERNYYGDVGLVCLINPADVVSVPKDDNYGKLRCCAYLPIDYAKFDNYGHIIPYDVKDGFECQYVPKIIYEGILGTEQDSPYRINVPDVPTINKDNIYKGLLDIAKRAIMNRVIKADEQEN